MVLGLYYMTRERPLARGEGKNFANVEEVRIAYDHEEIDLHARITVRMSPLLATGIVPAAVEANGHPRGKAKERAAAAAANTEPVLERVTTTGGRELLYEIVPPEGPFTELNKTVKTKELVSLIDIVR